MVILCKCLSYFVNTISNWFNHCTGRIQTFWKNRIMQFLRISIANWWWASIYLVFKKGWLLEFYKKRGKWKVNKRWRRIREMRLQDRNHWIQNLRDFDLFLLILHYTFIILISWVKCICTLFFHSPRYLRRLKSRFSHSNASY